MASSSHTQSAKHSKKRKSAAADLSTSDLHVVVEEASTSAGPAFVNFPSIRPSKHTPFTIYSRDVGSSSDLTKQHSLIAGETEDVQFFSTNRDIQLNRSEGSDCQYLPAIYDPASQTLHINPSTPLYLLTHEVKRLRAAGLSSNPVADARAQWREKRNNLGEAFGTRKAKTQIKAEERNKVDVGAMQGVKGHLMESIGEKVITAGDEPPSEFIPVPNVGTSDVTEVYPRSSLIPDSEWTAIDVSQLLEAKDDKARVGLLPWRRSLWVQDKLRAVVHGTKSLRKSHSKMLFYLSCLLAFYDFAPRLSKTPPSELTSKLPGIPHQLIDGLITRFAETAGKRHSVTEAMKTKLLAWICVLYLTLDGYAVEIAKVAKDMKMEPVKIANMYKSLGCTVNLATPAEREKQGLSMADAQAARKAVLVAPVKFPKIARRGPVKR